MQKVIVGIVTFNPNIEVLKRNISTLLNENARIIISDNNSTNIEEIKSTIPDTVDLIENDSNKGIAVALNQIMKFSKQNQYTWVATFDQDTIVPPNYLEVALGESYTDKTAMIAPVIYDFNRKVVDKTSLVGAKSDNKLISIRKCITSGALTNTEIWHAVGGFREDLFIDGVDFEFCNRIIKNGFEIYQNINLKIEHSIGHGKVFYLGPIALDLHNHNAFRKYYIVRNKLYCDFLINNNINIGTIFSVGKIIILIILFEQDKKNKISASLKGIKDGIQLIRIEKKKD